MSPKEKAIELIDKFHQYEWDQEKGWMPDKKETKKMVEKVIDEIVTYRDQWGVTSSKGYFEAVRTEVKRFFE